MTRSRALSTSDKKNDKKESCAEHILQRARQLNRAFTYLDLGETFSYGSYRNTTSQLVATGDLLKLPKENPARFILPEWASSPEYRFAQSRDKNGMGGRFDLLSFLEGLGWEPVLGVHGLKLAFSVASLDWLDNSWEYNKRSHSYRCHFNLSYTVTVQCFDTGTVLVSIKSSVKPFPLDPDGMLALANLLGEVRACLRTPRVPEPSSWIIVQWHLNRDSEEIALDRTFHVTFRDFFNDVARFYYKRELSKVRAEAVQSPNRNLKDVFESVLNRENGGVL